MCGRVRLSSDYSEIKIKLKFDGPPPNFERDWNKPPTAPMLVAIRSMDGRRTPKMMRWGLLPHWAKDEKIAYSTSTRELKSSRENLRFAMPGKVASVVSSLRMVSTSGRSSILRERKNSP
jgi:putative SOS response-associated peptidase YedK